MEKRKFRRNESGAVLLTVLCVMTMMIILVAAAITFVNQTTQKTYRTFQAEQAYMTASTCLESYVKEIERVTNSADEAGSTEAQENYIKLLESLADENNGKGYEYDVLVNDSKDIDKMGSCTIRVSRYNSNTLVITATAKFGQETDQVAAYVQTLTQPKKADFSNAIEMALDEGTKFEQVKVIGDVASITGNIDESAPPVYVLHNGTAVYGSLHIVGTVTPEANAYVTLMPNSVTGSAGGKVEVWGDITSPQNPFIVTAAAERVTGSNYINATGDINMSGGAYFKAGNYGTIPDPDDETKTKNIKLEVDVYCHDFNCGAKLTQVGDLHCYKTGDEANGGNLTLSGNAGGSTVDGDIFVDGNIYVNITADDVLVSTGTIKCSGAVIWGSHTLTQADVKSVTATDAATGKEIIVSQYVQLPQEDGGNQKKIISAKSIVLGEEFTHEDREKKPDMQKNINEYEVMPEEILLSTDSKVGILRNQYLASYSSSAKTLGEIVVDQILNGTSYTDATTNRITLTDDGITSQYAAMIDQDCVITKDDYNKLNAQAYKDDWAFDSNTGKLIRDTSAYKTKLMADNGWDESQYWTYYNNYIKLIRDYPQYNKFNGGNLTKYLIHVTDKDILIRLDTDTLEKFTFVIKNDSPEDDRKFVYFVPSAGTDINNPIPCTYNVANCGFIQYKTYIHLYKGQDGLTKLNQSITQDSNYNSKFLFNATNKEVPASTKYDIHTPEDNTLVILLTNKCNWTGKSMPQFIQGTIYGPDAFYYSDTNGLQSVPILYKYDTAKGGEPQADGIISGDGIVSCGMIITGTFENHNSSFYIFSKPAAGGVLSIVKGARVQTLTGYNLLRYDHH